ncbi:MAG: hypothetical protein ACE5JS_23405 [Nitrospinota bacterium]
MVDTGASDTVLPGDVLARLGVDPVDRSPYELLILEQTTKRAQAV